jgi:hypothetical protein
VWLLLERPARDLVGALEAAEAQEVARVVSQLTRPDERVLVLGSEPEICFYARRRSATGFIYMYSLMEEHEHAAELRRRMMREVDERAPDVIVYVAVPGSWARRGGDYSAFDAWVERLTRETTIVGSCLSESLPSQ